MTDIPEPGSPGYPGDRLGQLRNYVCRLDDNDEMIELDDVLGYLDEGAGLGALIDPGDRSLMQSTKDWVAQRDRLCEQEAEGKDGPPSADAWAHSDDEAALLLRSIAAALGWTEADDA